MGRVYAEEVATLSETYAWSLEANLDDLGKAVAALREHPLLVVGSGGSLSACHFVARMHESRARLLARVLTPLEFLRHPVPQTAGVLLLSASGANPDILTAAAHALSSGYSTVASLSTRADTPLRAQLALHRHARMCEFAGPSRKDGFLATNSLLLTCVVLARAYAVEMPDALPALARAEVDTTLAAGRGGGRRRSSLAPHLLRPNIVVLGGGWAGSAAADLESKWSEAGFGSVTVTDARNFAHGRHYGLARRITETFVLGLSVAGEASVIDRTMSKLPRRAATGVLASPLDKEVGAIDLLTRVIQLTGEVGRHAGVDPGRPRVPLFGRALYRATLPRDMRLISQGLPLKDLWIERKVTPAAWAAANDHVRAAWRLARDEWAVRVESSLVGAIVLDYDGTLCEANERFGAPAAQVGEALTRLIDYGLRVGIATGRGDSVVRALRTVLPERVWSKVLVGIYNGALLFWLHESLPLSGAEEPSIATAREVLVTSPVVSGLAEVRQRSAQLTVLAKQPLPHGLLGRFVSEALAAAREVPEVDVFASGHSVDVIARGASKHRVVQALRDSIGSEAVSILTIGDQGQARGNDERFLAHELGLSVESASSVFDGCWNVAPRGSRGTAAMLHYLGALVTVGAGTCRFSIAKASGLGHPPHDGANRPRPRVPAAEQPSGTSLCPSDTLPCAADSA